MSLNCLACSQVVKRTDSPIECAPESPSLRKSRSMAVDRGSWSGNNNINVTPPQERHGTRGPMAKIKREHRRTQSAADAFQGEPRLIRSPGMRRDWSFENLADKK